MQTQKIKIILRKSPQIWKIVVYLIYFVAFFVSLIVFFYVLIILTPIIALLLAFLCFLFSDSICWQLMGKEIIEIDKNGVQIYKRGRLMQKKHVISGQLHCRCQKHPYSYLASFGLFFGTRGGCIKMTDDAGEEFYFGQSLNKEEAYALIYLMETFQENPTQEIPDVLKKFIK